jgi:hypothetical protein
MIDESTNMIAVFTVSMCAARTEWQPETHDITLQRCHCHHAVSQVCAFVCCSIAHAQVVDCLLQHILYDRQVVPVLVGQLLVDSTSLTTTPAHRKAVDAFVDSYTRVRTTLFDAFRSHMVGKVSQVAIVLGQTVHNPYEVYRLRLPLTCTADCSDGHMHAKDERMLSQQLFTSTLAQSFRLQYAHLPNARHVEAHTFHQCSDVVSSHCTVRVTLICWAHVK